MQVVLVVLLAAASAAGKPQADVAFAILEFR